MFVFFKKTSIYCIKTGAPSTSWHRLTEPAAHICCVNKTCNIIDYYSMPKSTSAGNSLGLIWGCKLSESFCRAATLLSVKAAVAHPPRFSWFSRLFSPLAAHTEQRPNDVPLGRMCRTTTYSELFFLLLSHRRFKRGTLRQISCERPFLYVSHTMVCLSVEGRPSGHRRWQGKSFCTCSPTQGKESGENRKWHTR